MKEYAFELRFSLPSGEAVSDGLIERLGNGGCDDALIGIGRAGRIALEFVRESDSAHNAILGAIADVRGAVPRAVLFEVKPDIVGVTDVADFVGCSRQNMRKLLWSRTSPGPVPLHEGASSLWHLAPVLRWLASVKGYPVSRELLEIAEAAMSVNTAVDALRISTDLKVEIQELLA